MGNGPERTGFSDAPIDWMLIKHPPGENITIPPFIAQALGVGFQGLFYSPFSQIADGLAEIESHMSKFGKVPQVMGTLREMRLQFLASRTLFQRMQTTGRAYLEEYGGGYRLHLPWTRTLRPPLTIRTTISLQGEPLELLQGALSHEFGNTFTPVLAGSSIVLRRTGLEGAALVHDATQTVQSRFSGFLKSRQLELEVTSKGRVIMHPTPSSSQAA